MKCCVSTNVGTSWTWKNLLTFEPDPDYSSDAGTGLLSPISYKRCYVEFYVGKIPRLHIGSPALQRGMVFISDTLIVYFTELLLYLLSVIAHITALQKLKQKIF